MVHFLSLFALPAVAVAVAFVAPGFTTHSSPPSIKSRRRPHCQYVHSSIHSPLSTEEVSSSQHTKTLHRLNKESAFDNADKDQLSALCQLLRAQPQNSIRLETTPDGVRGVYLNNLVNEGQIILSIPLESCLVDDKVPMWMPQDNCDDGSSGGINYNPSSWATRLAASLLDLQLRNNKDSYSQTNEGHALWLSLLPNSDHLLASLPVHWPDETLQSTRCTELELAVDSAFFARAQATEDLVHALANDCVDAKGIYDEKLRKMCDKALDIVQTRTCRVEQRDNDSSPLRIVAPIFDMINHGSSNSRGDSSANAQFGLEYQDDDEARLVVRASKNMEVDEEVLINYGESARAPWKCLFSYGFVPANDETANEESNNVVAEVYMDGVRYEVTPSTIPVDMVAAAIASWETDHGIGGDKVVDESELVLTPAVALRIAKRISDVAYQLLLEPEKDMHDDHPAITPTPFQVISNQLAASLRWSQHRVLMACSLGLHDFATEDSSFS
jgi:hypothetical protein